MNQRVVFSETTFLKQGLIIKTYCTHKIGLMLQELRLVEVSMDYSGI